MDKPPSDASILRSFNAGLSAGRRRLGRHSNPHLPETHAEKFQAWNLGYDEGHPQ